MSSKRIMIVEDEIIIAMDLKNRILSLGYEVCAVALSYEECIKKVELNKPDLILMDIVLKEKDDGIRAAEMIKNVYNLPVVFLTAYADSTTLKKAKLSEPYGYIIKPYDIKELHTNIEIAIYKHSMELKLAESELKYRTLFSTATDAVIIMNESGIITSANLSALNMFGYEENEIIGLDIKKLLPYAFVNHFEEGVKRFLESGKFIENNIFEIVTERNNGERFPAELSFSSWKVGLENNYTLIIRDISKRKEAERELRKVHEELEIRVEERTAELKSLIDQSPLPIRIFNNEGFLIYSNNSWDHLFKNASEPSTNIFHDPTMLRNGYRNAFKRIFDFGGSFTTKPLFFDPTEDTLLNSEEGVILIFHFYAVFTEKSKIFRVVNVVQNITERVKIEEAYKELNNQKVRAAFIFENLERERNRISRELHDSIGQILYAIKFNLELLAKETQYKSVYLDNARTLMTNAGNELKNIINSIHPRVLDELGLLSSLKMLIEELSKTTNIKFNFNCNNGTLRLDPQLELTIYRIIQEATNNIIKHSFANCAEVELDCLNNVIECRIIDNGKGFNSSELKDAPYSKKFGIRSMKERVELLGGKFFIESSQNGGTEISFEIPIDQKYEN